MKVVYKNMLDVSVLRGADATCITTNGFVTSKGNAVMGRGIAREIASKIPSLPSTLGQFIQAYGNRVLRLTDTKPAILSFPVKPKTLLITDLNQVVSHGRSKYTVGDNIPGFHAKADIEIIAKSCIQLVKLADKFGYTRIHLPKPGCGAGELSWDEVEKVLDTYLDDRFVVFDFKANEKKEPKQTKTIVMLCGSLGVHRLSKEVTDTLDILMGKGVDIVIGDAVGADKCMQEYLYSKNYSKVTVYHIAKTCRTNIGRWAEVSVPIGKGAYTPYAYKDIAMCNIADYLLAVMNKGTSTRGTSDNINRFKKNKRFHKVLYI